MFGVRYWKMNCSKLFKSFVFWSQIRSYWPSGNACGSAVGKSRGCCRKWSIHRSWLYGKTACGILQRYECFRHREKGNIEPQEKRNKKTPMIYLQHGANFVVGSRVLSLLLFWSHLLLGSIDVFLHLQIYSVLLHRCTCSDMIQRMADTRVK